MMMMMMMTVLVAIGNVAAGSVGNDGSLGARRSLSIVVRVIILQCQTFVFIGK